MRVAEDATPLIATEILAGITSGYDNVAIGANALGLVTVGDRLVSFIDADEATWERLLCSPEEP
jgi:hypothetical protein